MFEKKKKGHRSVNYVWPLAGAYLIYQGARLLLMCANGTASRMILDLAVGVFFMAIGAVVILREWHIYKNVPVVPEDMEDSSEKETSDEIPPEDEPDDETESAPDTAVTPESDSPEEEALLDSGEMTGENESEAAND